MSVSTGPATSASAVRTVVVMPLAARTSPARAATTSTA